LPSAYSAASVADLIADIKAANQHGGSNTITLAPNTPFPLTAVNNTADGATGLPVIKAGNNLTILGNGDTLARSTDPGTPAFRLFDVASGAAVTLTNLTVQNGLAFGAGAAADGGAIYNQGTLVLDGVTVLANTARGSDGKSSPIRGGGQSGGPGSDAAGGGIWSNGSLTLANGTRVQSNHASGGLGGDSYGPGGNAFGGGVYVAGGTANVISATLANNTAVGGDGGSTDGGGGGAAGGAFGGGLYVAGGTVSLGSDTVTGNAATGNGYNHDGGGLYVAGGTVSLSNDTVASNTAPYGSGGGLYIATAATVSLDTFTVNHTTNNTAGVSPDIAGSYTLQ
jgi:hypothetical protein